MNRVYLFCTIIWVLNLGIFLGAYTMKSKMQHKAVENNCTQFNSKTSDFEYIKNE